MRPDEARAMTDTTIHYRLKTELIYSTAYGARSRCSCGWLSPESASAYAVTAMDEAEELLLEHQESQLQPTKGAENDTRKE
jgi:hypothetical protein